MSMKDGERFHQLMQIAEQDEIYVVWKKAMKNSVENLRVWRNGVPKKYVVFCMAMETVGG